MNNKGFTLVEVLAVIVLLIVIFMIIVPSVTSVVRKSKNTVYQKQINTILTATYDWSLKNVNNLPEKNEKVFVTLGELKINGLVDANIVDSNTREPFPDDLVISITNVGSIYKAKDKYSKKEGNYLYTAEIKLMETTGYINKKPTIVLNSLTPNSDGDYTTSIDINTTFSNVSYTATSNNGKDLTDKVIVNIIYNDELVESVDTSKSGIYYINYTVVDEDGYSNKVTRNVIVTDNEKPIILLPENNTISTSVTTFDLMNGVSCTDNSNSCKITTSGEIDFGVPGKYIIEYTAKDSSGNTETVKRVITIG